MSSSDRTLMTTPQAARLVDRNESSVREAIANKELHADRDERGRWLVAPDDVIAWDKRAGRNPHCSAARTWERAATLLADYGSLNAEELAVLLSVHPGNARKHLAILAKQGRARRLDDGQWVLVDVEGQGAA